MTEEAPTGWGPEDKSTKSVKVLSGSYAWRRYFARAVDTTVVMAIILFVLGFVISVIMFIVNRQEARALEAWLHNIGMLGVILTGIIAIVLWFPIEALFLWRLGTTPGKFIFGISVHTQAGKNPGYWQSLYRAVQVFTRGQGLGIPLISLITLVLSYDQLVTAGSMSWDRSVGTSVNYAKMTDTRLVFCILAAIVWGLYSAAGYINFLTKMR